MGVAARRLVDLGMGVTGRPARRPDARTIDRAIYAQCRAILADYAAPEGPCG